MVGKIKKKKMAGKMKKKEPRKKKIMASFPAKTWPLASGEQVRLVYGADYLDAWDTRYRLFEFPASVTKTLEEGASLTLKGHQNDLAVICTDSETYELRLAETTNTLIVAEAVPTEGSAVILSAGIKSYCELIRVAPHLDRLTDMLQTKPY